ncbi:MAG: lysylphosphatidylglycerol synthase transmembrane domain-containing protein [Phycisphaerae bacterium]|nr:lysylphosphatidylglycerol synthase transmembrane domain-containing protein [Phycisphaerae bacterium]
MNKRVRTILWHVARLAIMAALVAWVVSRAEWNDTVRDGTHVAGIKTIALRLAHEWWWVAAALGVMTLQSPVGAVRWRLLLKVQGIHITLLESLRLTYIGWFFNNWMPGATGGDFVKAWYIARQTHRKPEAVTVVFLDRFIGMTALALLGAVAAAASLGDARVRTAQWIVAAFLVATAAGCGLFYSRRVRRALRVDALVARLPLRPIVARVDRALFIYRGHKGTVAAAMAYSWVAQAVSVFCMYFLALGLGAGAGLVHYFVNMPVVWVGWSLVPVPGGFGVAEGLVQQLFSAPVLGVQTAAEAATLALAMVLAYRLVQMAISLPGAILYLARRTDISPRTMREALQTADLEPAEAAPSALPDAEGPDA